VVSDAAPVAALSVRDALASGAARLAGAGCDTPRLDAEVLLAAVLGVGRERLVLDAFEAVGIEAQRRFSDFVARRAAREPVAYITGLKGFRRLELQVDRRVLIPRPETELLVEAGLSLAAGSSVVDVGTGSGAVALALKDERPDLIVTGVDVSVGALDLARRNAARLGLDVRFVSADLLHGVDGPFDAVLANLPYVAADDASLAPEITSYEPPCALYGGADGLDLVRRLIGMLDGVPFVALEIGAGQADAVALLLEGAGYSVARRVDLAGVERVLVGRR
jgi:release factor glutamine methyltransferase